MGQELHLYEQPAGTGGSAIIPAKTADEKKRTDGLTRVRSKFCFTFPAV
jgi:hypothetical protein